MPHFYILDSLRSISSNYWVIFEVEGVLLNFIFFVLKTNQEVKAFEYEIIKIISFIRP